MRRPLAALTLPVCLGSALALVLSARLAVGEPDENEPVPGEAIQAIEVTVSPPATRPAEAIAASTRPAAVAAPTTRPTSGPTTQPIDAGLSALIEKLTDEQWAVRQSAESNLVDLVRNRDELHEQIRSLAEVHPNPEVRSRLASVLGELVELERFGATPISIHVDHAHPRQVVEQLSEEAGVKIELWPPEPWGPGDAGETVSLHIDEVPFWDAVAIIEKETGLAPMPYRQEGFVLTRQGRFGGEEGLSYPQCRDGAFVIQARRVFVNSNSHLDLGLDEAGKAVGPRNEHESAGLELWLLVEPKVELLSTASRPTVEVAQDEQGRPLLQAQPNEEIGVRYPNNSSWVQQVSLPLDPQAVRRGELIKELRGHIEVEAAVEMETFRIDDLPSSLQGKESSATVGEYLIKVISLTGPDNGEQWELSLEITNPRGSDQYQLMRSLERLRLLDEQGRALNNGGSSINHEGATLKVTRHFRRDGETSRPVTLVWSVPTRTRTLRIPFVFENLPLP